MHWLTLCVNKWMYLLIYLLTYLSKLLVVCCSTFKWDVGHFQWRILKYCINFSCQFSMAWILTFNLVRKKVTKNCSVYCDLDCDFEPQPWAITAVLWSIPRSCLSLWVTTPFLSSCSGQEQQLITDLKFYLRLTQPPSWKVGLMSSELEGTCEIIALFFLHNGPRTR